MNSTQVIIDEIRERAVISEVIGERIAVIRKGRRLSALCPFHDDHKPSMSISDEKRLFKCFACGVGGDAIKFVMEYDKCTFAEAIKNLARKYSLTLPAGFLGGEIKNFSDSHLKIKGLLALVQKSYSRYLKQHPLAEHARSYLQKRKISQQLIDKFALGQAPGDSGFLEKFLRMNPVMKKRFKEKDLLESGLVKKKQYGDGLYDFFRERLIFPIRNEKGETLGFGGRTLAEKEEIKYLNSADSPWFHKGKILYGLFECYQQLMQKKYAILCEGYFDVIALQSIGEPALATLGSALTLEQLRKLKRYTSKVMLVFDGDEAGRKAAFLAASLAAALEMDGVVVCLENNEDPFDLVFRCHGDAILIKEILAKHSQPLYDFLVRAHKTVAGKSPGLLEEKQAFENMLPILASMKSPVLQAAFNKKIHESFHANAQEALKTTKVFPLTEARGYAGGKRIYAGQEASGLQEALNNKRESSYALNRSSQAKPVESKPFESLAKTVQHLENCFVEFLLQNPQFIRKASALIAPEEFQNASMKAFYAKLAHLKNLENISLHHILDQFEEKKELVDYIMSKALRKTKTWQDPQRLEETSGELAEASEARQNKELEKEFQQCYLMMKLRQKAYRISRLDYTLCKIESRGQVNHEKRLLEVKEEIMKQREEMKNIDEYFTQLEPESLYTRSISAYHLHPLPLSLRKASPQRKASP